MGMTLSNGVIFAKRYILEKRLGRGGFSEVWLAKDIKADILVALKIYAPYGGMDDNGVNVFGQEYSNVFNLNHANLLRPSHYDVEENSPYLVMPYMSNGSANKYIGNMPEKEVWKFIRDVASGLLYLHSSDPPVIHQDIKPGNILIDDNGNYLITDFGISVKARSTLRKSTVNMEGFGGGTQAYMGPERFSSEPTPIIASDIWSLGATLFEIMEGDTPFGEMGGVLQKSGADIPNMHGDYSQKLKELVCECLSLDKLKRPTASELVDIADEMIMGVGKKRRKRKKKNNNGGNKTIRQIIFLIVFLLAVLGGVGYYFANKVIFDINPYMLTYDETGGKSVITVKRNSKSELHIDVNENWLNIKQIEDSVIVECEKNESIKGRATQISFSDAKATKILDVSQKGAAPKVVFSKQELVVNSDEGKETIVVESNCDWNCSSSASWLKVEKYRNNIYVSYADNPGVKQRNGNIIVEYEGYVKTIGVTQNERNRYLILNNSKSNAEYRVAASGGNKTYSVRCSSSDFIVNAPLSSWCKIKNKDKFGFDIVCVENTTIDERSCNVDVYADNLSLSVLVIQDGASPMLTLDGSSSSISKSFSSSGGRKTISVNTNIGSYDTWGIPNWCSVVNKSNSSFELVCEPNDGTTERSDFMKIKAGTKEVKITITQTGVTTLKVDGKTSDFTKNFDANGGRVTISVSTNASSYETWGVPSWCSIESKYSSSFVLVCKSNTSSTSRSDYMKVKAGSKEIRIDIKQEAKKQPTVTINEVWQDHNVFNGLSKGMKVHAKYTAENMKGRYIYCTIFFYYADNTTPLRDAWGNALSFSTNKSEASYESTEWPDSWIFVPYPSLNMVPGWSGILTFDVVIKDNYGNVLARKNNNSFTFTNPGF